MATDITIQPLTQYNIISFDVGIKNLAYMILHMDCNTRTMTIRAWDILPLVSDGENANKVGVDTLSTRLYKALHMLYESYPINYVLIENQPALKNPVMKTIQVLIYSFYTYHKVLLQAPIQPIRLMSATSKLKLGKDIDVTLDSEPANKYKKNKLLGIAYANYFLPYCQNAITDEYDARFQSHKKKDDLADAFLQIVAFVKEQKWMDFATTTNIECVRVS